MSIQQTAQAAVAVFPPSSITTSQSVLPLRVVMVAISGAETGGTWDPSAVGDPCTAYPSLPCCQGGTSFGLWQIHTVHSAYLTRITGSSNACDWLAWLSTPKNCAIAAYNIYESQGLNAWSTYADGSWTPHIAAARSAVQAAEQQASAPGIAAVVTPTRPILSRPVVGWGLVGLAAIAGGLTVLAVEADGHWPQLKAWGKREAQGARTDWERMSGNE